MRKKSVIIGFCLILFLGISLGAQAESTIKEVKAYINKEIRLTLNGESWTPKDEDEQVQSPLIYNGYTYLPLRSIGAVSGMSVDWDADTKTVAILAPNQDAAKDGRTGEPKIDEVGYGEVKYPLMNKTIRLASDITLVQRIPGMISFPLHNRPYSGAPFEVGYSLYGAAKRVYGQLFTASILGSEVQFTVLDREHDKVLFQSPKLTSRDKPLEFSVNTTGVKELSIKAYLLSESSEPGVEVNAVIRNLTVVADKSVPESMFDITQSNHLTP